MGKRRFGLPPSSRAASSAWAPSVIWVRCAPTRAVGLQGERVRPPWKTAAVCSCMMVAAASWLGVRTTSGWRAPDVRWGLTLEGLTSDVLTVVLPDDENDTEPHPWSWLADLARARGLTWPQTTCASCGTRSSSPTSCGDGLKPTETNRRNLARPTTPRTRPRRLGHRSLQARFSASRRRRRRRPDAGHSYTGPDRRSVDERRPEHPSGRSSRAPAGQERRARGRPALGWPNRTAELALDLVDPRRVGSTIRRARALFSRRYRCGQEPCPRPHWPRRAGP